MWAALTVLLEATLPTPSAAAATPAVTSTTNLLATTASAGGPVAPFVAAGWRLISPDGAQASAAVMRTPDLLRSDPDLAGIMLQCNPNGLDVSLVVVSPYPPRSHPRVTISGSHHFEGKTNDYGNAVTLPSAAVNVLWEMHKDTHELTIEISSGDSRLHAIVPLAGLKGAVESLPPRCRL